MARSTAVIAALLLIGLFGLSQEKQEKKESPPAATEFKIPAEQAKRENPIKPTEASVAEGKRLYGYDCAMCHGKTGDGKGDLVEPMGLKLTDLRDPAVLKDLSDGGIYYILAKGKGKMPGNDDRMKPEQRWNVVNFLRSLAKKEPPTPPAAPPKIEKPD